MQPQVSVLTTFRNSQEVTDIRQNITAGMDSADLIDRNDHMWSASRGSSIERQLVAQASLNDSVERIRPQPAKNTDIVFRQSQMNFGTSAKNDYERVTK